MNIEKWVSYLIACLTMLIIAFNLVGSLWMIVLEKKKDISVLKSIGMTSNDIRKIFLSIGLYVALAGLAAGFIIALIFYSVQTNYGIISIPDGFIIDAYPIELKWTDFIIVSATVLVIGLAAAWLPAQRAASVTAFVRHE
jgi:lipoprotein-releasing system permease protein